MPIIKWAKVLEHAVACQMFQRGSHKVRCGSHHKQMRQTVVVQPLYDVLHARQRINVGYERTCQVHRPDLDTDSARFYVVQHRFNDLEEETGAVGDRASILVRSEVSGTIQELSDQIEVVSLD